MTVKQGISCCGFCLLFFYDYTLMREYLDEIIMLFVFGIEWEKVDKLYETCL